MAESMVTFKEHTPPNRSWLVVQPGATGYGFTPSATVNVDAFPAAERSAGRILSGRPVSKGTDGLWGPLDTSAESTAVSHGFLWDDEIVGDQGTSRVGNAVVEAFAVVDPARLPVALADADRAAFPLIHFVN